MLRILTDTLSSHVTIDTDASLHGAVRLSADSSSGSAGHNVDTDRPVGFQISPDLYRSWFDAWAGDIRKGQLLREQSTNWERYGHE